MKEENRRNGFLTWEIKVVQPVYRTTDAKELVLHCRGEIEWKHSHLFKRCVVRDNPSVLIFSPITSPYHHHHQFFKFHVFAFCTDLISTNSFYFPFFIFAKLLEWIVALFFAVFPTYPGERKYCSQCQKFGKRSSISKLNLRSGVFLFSGIARNKKGRRTAWSQVNLNFAIHVIWLSLKDEQTKNTLFLSPTPNQHNQKLVKQDCYRNVGER